MPTAVQPRPAPAAKYDAEVEQQLAQAVRRIRLNDVLTGVLILLAIVLGYVAAMVAADRWLDVPAWVRQAGLVGLLATLGVVGFYTVARPLRRMVNPLYAAKQVEETVPDAKNSIVNYVDLHDDPLPESIRAAVSARAAKQLEAADINEAVNSRRLVWAGAAVAALVVALAVLFLLFRPAQFFSLLGRTLTPFSAGAIATRTQITITHPAGGDLTVTAGQPVTVAVTVDGRVPDPDGPDRLRVRLRHNPADPNPEEVPLEPAGSNREWQVRIPDHLVQNGFWYAVAGGDALTAEHRVTVRSRPLFTAFEARYEYPAYLRLQPEVVREPQLEGYRGTQVTLTAKANRELRSGRMLVAGQPNAVPGEVVGEARDALRFRLTLAEAGSYRLFFTATTGEENADAPPYSIKVLSDQPPAVAITAPAEEEIVRPTNGLLEVDGRVGDDFGIDTVTLRLRLADGGGRTLQPKPYQGGKSFKRETDQTHPTSLEYKDSVPLTGLKDEAGQPVVLAEGMVLEYWLEATDNCTVPKPNLGKSKVQRVRLTPPPPEPMKQEEQKRQADQRKQAEAQHQQAQNQKLQAERRDPPPQPRPEAAEPKPGEAAPPPQPQPGGDPRPNTPEKGPEQPPPTPPENKGPNPPPQPMADPGAKPNPTDPPMAQPMPMGGGPENPPPMPNPAAAPPQPGNTGDPMPNPGAKAGDPKPEDIKRKAQEIEQALNDQERQPPGAARGADGTQPQQPQHPQPPAEPKGAAGREQNPPTEPKAGDAGNPTGAAEPKPPGKMPEPTPPAEPKATPGAKPEPGQPNAPQGEPETKQPPVGGAAGADKPAKPEPKPGEKPEPKAGEPGEARGAGGKTEKQPGGGDPTQPMPMNPAGTPEKGDGPQDPAAPKPAGKPDRGAVRPGPGEKPDTKPGDAPPAAAKADQPPPAAEKKGTPQPAPAGANPDQKPAAADAKPAGGAPMTGGKDEAAAPKGEGARPGQPSAGGPKPPKMDPKDVEQAVKEMASGDEKKGQEAADRIEQALGKDAREKAEQAAKGMKSGDARQQADAKQKLDDLKADAERLSREEVKPDPNGLPERDVERLFREAQKLNSPNPEERQKAEQNLDKELGKKNREQLQQQMKDGKPGDAGQEAAAKNQIGEMAKQQPKAGGDPKAGQPGQDVEKGTAKAGQPPADAGKPEPGKPEPKNGAGGQAQAPKVDPKEMEQAVKDLASGDPQKQKEARDKLDQMVGKEARQQAEQLQKDLNSPDEKTRAAAQQKVEELKKQAAQAAGRQPKREPTAEEKKQLADAAKDLTSDDQAKQQAARDKLDKMIGPDARKQAEQLANDLKSGDADKRAAAQKKLEDLQKQAAGEPGKKELTPEEKKQLADIARDLGSKDPQKQKEAAEKLANSQLGKDLAEGLQKQTEKMAKNMDDPKKPDLDKARDALEAVQNMRDLAKQMDDLKSGDPKKAEEALNNLKDLADRMKNGQPGRDRGETPPGPPLPGPSANPDAIGRGPGGSPDNKGEPLKGNEDFGKLPSELQLEKFKKAKDNPELLKQLGYTPEDYERFLKGFEEVVKQEKAQQEQQAKKAPAPPPAGPVVNVGEATNKLEHRGDGSKGNPQGGGPAYAPPGYSEAQRKFAEAASRRRQPEQEKK